MSSLPIFDRGPSPYFHGREEILQTFSDYLTLFKKGKGGTTFLIQGAPGAGKTALLDQCGKRSLSRGWHTAKIKSGALWNPDQLAHSLGMKPRVQFTGGSGQIGLDDVVKANVKLDVAVKYATLTILKIIESRRKPLLLILDEAQSLGKPDIIPSDQRGVVTNVLDYIHNGELKRPVVLLAAGLGTTFRTFKSFGISRFGKNCIVQLGALDKESERAVMQDWLIEEGSASGSTKVWIDSIARETHGWPQHIISYIEPALESIKSNNCQMTDEGLEYVLERGAEFRKEFYNSRANDIREKQRQVLANAISDLPLGGTAEYEDIIDIIKHEYGQKEAEDLFNKALDQGIIDERKSGRYGIPIPSMQTWLLDEYGRERIEVPRDDVRVKVKKHTRDGRKWNQER